MSLGPTDCRFGRVKKFFLDIYAECLGRGNVPRALTSGYIRRTLQHLSILDVSRRPANCVWIQLGTDGYLLSHESLRVGT